MECAPQWGMERAQSKEQLNAREGHFIRNKDSYNNGYNGQIAGRNIAQYYQDNKEELKKQHLQYYQDNKEELNARNICSCGSKYAYQHKARHHKSIRHQHFLQQQVIELEQDVQNLMLIEIA